MLERYRVIDLTDERGNLAAFILAGLGADVVLVEPPEGSAGRRRGPFAGDQADAERSLTFWGWNRGKRSVVLDVDGAAGAAALQRLCAEADVVIECGALAVDLAAHASGRSGTGHGVDQPVRLHRPEVRLAGDRPDGERGRVPAGDHG